MLSATVSGEVMLSLARAMVRYLPEVIPPHGSPSSRHGEWPRMRGKGSAKLCGTNKTITSNDCSKNDGGKFVMCEVAPFSRLELHTKRKQSRACSLLKKALWKRPTILLYLLGWFKDIGSWSKPDYGYYKSYGSLHYRPGKSVLIYAMLFTSAH